MKSTYRRFASSLGVMAVISAAVLSAGQAVAAPYAPLSGDVSVQIIAGAPPTGAIGLSTGPTGVERPVYYRPGSTVALDIGSKNQLSVRPGCKPTEFKDDDGTTIPVWVKLDCAGKAWQGKLSKEGSVFIVKPLP